MNKKYTQSDRRRAMISRIYHKDADDEGWATINGNHIHFNEKGQIDKGNPKVIAEIKKSGASEEKGLTENNKSDIIKAKKPVVKFSVPSPQNFLNALKAARDSQPLKRQWRVDTSHPEDYYKDCKIYTTEHGSTVAVKPDGDIISVCKKIGDSVRGVDLLEHAVKNGGKKLDSYSGNHEFYVKCGFEPVSWCEFSDLYDIPGWDATRDDREPIIFYKYTGKQSKYAEAADFMASVRPSKDYDAAQIERDKQI